MSCPQQQEECKEGAPEWVVTFGDMMTLLLCFFVLLLSFSTMETERFKIVAGYIREAFGVQMNRRYTEIPSGDTVVTVEFNPPSLSNTTIYEQIVDLLESLQLDQMANAEMEADGVRLRLDGELAFKPGSAQLTDESKLFLDYVAETVLNANASVRIEGHTDNAPIKSKIYPSNWELSGARASAVVRYLESRGVPGAYLEAVAFGDTRPITENYTEEGRRKNRRVELLIEPPK
ncbi:MAG: flagellar motor protein MotB [Acidobacteriota bacterium]|nr:flagellar motor protein MotB [Acidobacteriota bacterium]